VRSHLSFRSKRELLLQIAPLYREASPALKTVILDEFVAATGYARKYAIRLLRHPVAPKLTIERPRPPLDATRGTTGAAPGVDGVQPHLRQAVDPLPANTG
jgi:hypothetical protein